ncbi:hydroxylamine reductase [Propionibacterium sp.]|uniref:hydroxylamine reductase n=1 Tax=Propionibacterium sp. TaxID=1977903 RepID=UPI0039E76974
MFCFQCEQTARSSACTEVGVCGKDPATAAAQDAITVELMKLAVASEGRQPSAELVKTFTEALFATVTNVNFDAALCERIADDIATQAREANGGHAVVLDAVTGEKSLFEAASTEGSCRALLILGLRGTAAYAYHAHVLGQHDPQVDAWLITGMAQASRHHEVAEWLDLLHEAGMINFACLELLDRANTGAYGDPEPTEVSMEIAPGPFIVVSGHDLHDLAMLLEQCEGTGVAVYTHGEMLPAHGYPGLHAYSCLKGHFGTAWQNQRNEFTDLPGAVLFTTNCLMPPREDYRENVFTTAMVGHPGVTHIDADSAGHKDFGPVIEHAKQLGGWDTAKVLTGINGGSTLTTGFAHHAVLSVADAVIGAIKAGDVNHIYLVGGCDGAMHGRNYFTRLVESTPKDSLVLTLACGKFRFNDMQLGTVGGLPRLLDMGQCNDAYSAVKVAQALASAFGVGINELPLTIVLSWYEQKAVAVLLSLLALGVKNIKLGPTLPAFVSPGVLQVLSDAFGLAPTSTVEEDLAPAAG